MNLIVWLAFGGLIGWIAGALMHSGGGILMNVVIGIAGAFIGGWLIGPMVGAGSINSSDFSVIGLAVSVLGAVILLGVVSLLTRGRWR